MGTILRDPCDIDHAHVHVPSPSSVRSRKIRGMAQTNQEIRNHMEQA
jgi:hypothetical protein